MKRFASNQSPNFLCAAACLAVLIAGCGDNGDSSTDPGAQKAQITAASRGPTEAGGSRSGMTSEGPDCANVTMEPEPNDKGETCFRCLDADDNLVSRQCSDLRPKPTAPNTPGCARLQPVANDKGQDCWDCIAASGKSLGVECLPHRE